MMAIMIEQKQINRIFVDITVRKHGYCVFNTRNISNNNSHDLLYVIIQRL